MTLKDQLRNIVKGEVLATDAALEHYSRDASLFEVRPKVIVFPKDADDIKAVVRFVAEYKKEDPTLSITARSAGTDMSGGPLNESIILDVTHHLNSDPIFSDSHAIVEPGMYYRDFEKQATAHGLFFPSYPASKGLCALGGMVANDAGGEKSLRYGKTHNFVEEMKVIWRDGNEYVVKKLTKNELDKKMMQQNIEGQIYRELYDLLEKNYEVVHAAKPDVSKNSSGYNIWDVWDRQTFDMPKLFVGSQGTLGIITKAKLRLEKIKPHSGMAIMFMKSLEPAAGLVKAITPLQPTSFESFDDHTLKLALKFFPGFLKMLGAKNFFSLMFRFVPEFWTVLTYGMPKLVFLVEFEGDTPSDVERKLADVERVAAGFDVKLKFARTKAQTQKYWAIRRESFNLLRTRIKDKQTAPFIDDFVVRPEFMPEFLPKVYQILDEYNFFYTIAGHAGDGNFHIIPLMTLANEDERKIIPIVSEKIYDLVLQYHGSITGEHNDGLIRTPYVEQMFGAEVYGLFEQVKKIFDPQNIFNPGKKVNGDLEYAMKHIKRN